MQQAKDIIRHSVVRYEGKLWMIENLRKSVTTLIRGTFGKEIKPTQELEVVMYPAQLAGYFLEGYEQTPIERRAAYQQALKDLSRYIDEVTEGGGEAPTMKEIKRDFINRSL